MLIKYIKYIQNLNLIFQLTIAFMKIKCFIFLCLIFNFSLFNDRYFIFGKISFKLINNSIFDVIIL